MPPGQVALNEPLALVLLCSVTLQRKSGHAVGDGSALDDDQVPSSGDVPVDDGPTVLSRS